MLLRVVMSVVVSVAVASAQPPLWPVAGTVVRGFVAPTCPRCAGHRGVDVRVAEGSPVRAVADGEITFSGSVARRLYVVERLSSGVLVTYGWLSGIEAGLETGDRVSRGQRVGSTGRLFYLGVRVRGVPVEPLGALGFGRPRLVGPGGVRSVTVGPRPPAR